jgi:hypothetical protein
MYTPTARLGHIRLARAIAGKYNLEILQMDVCTAFFGVAMEEEIYMHPPQGYFLGSNREIGNNFAQDGTPPEKIAL